ncbi:uncharacterized protein LOC113465247 isoform X2 [Ceratina calcarata]|uniref:Uncharacterized protein LOC113465247 isoform X2 n=1 Tax=Ceratina calcarata TaxID=156304 RepID=A0AAJ7SCL3_9HYME|nr:uncharacterized protein LOC113465247 isoform X2 [Ceratina calcarata]
MPGSNTPKIWCPKENYRSCETDGISMSTTSGSSNCKGWKDIGTVIYRGTRVKQQGELLILVPSTMVILDSEHSRLN